MNNVKIGIIDYGVSNLTSVINAFEHIGYSAEFISTADQVAGCSHLVLPGVGSFASGMANLNERQLVEPIIQHARTGKPLIGMCLGMQLLAKFGDEFGPTRGLGLIDDSVVRIPVSTASARLPHVGWNFVNGQGEGRLLRGVPDNATFYFVHSYCYSNPTANWVTGTFEYFGTHACIIEKDNLFGTQFHPEKSQKNGLNLLDNFVKVTAK